MPVHTIHRPRSKDTGVGIIRMYAVQRDLTRQRLRQSLQVSGTGRAALQRGKPALECFPLVDQPSASIAALTAGRAATRSWNFVKLANFDRSTFKNPAQQVTVNR